MKKTNSQNINLDTLKWTFGLKNFMNTDYQIYASSKIVYKNRAIFAAILSLIVAIILFIKKRK